MKSAHVLLDQLWYPRPNLDGQGYVGITEGIHYVYSGFFGHAWNPSLGMLAGYQFEWGKRYHFIEFKLGFPVGDRHPYKQEIPFVPSIAYGLSF